MKIFKHNSDNDPNKQLLKSYVLIAALSILLVIIICAGLVYFLINRYSAPNERDDSLTAQALDEDVLADIGELIDLPADEDPTIATVTNPEQLQDREFFSKAQAGDRVIMYIKSKRAILYRPATKKIIEIAPLLNAIESQQQ